MPEANAGRIAFLQGANELGLRHVAKYKSGRSPMMVSMWMKGSSNAYDDLVAVNHFQERDYEEEVVRLSKTGEWPTLRSLGWVDCQVVRQRRINAAKKAVATKRGEKTSPRRARVPSPAEGFPFLGYPPANDAIDEGEMVELFVEDVPLGPGETEDDVNAAVRRMLWSNFGVEHLSLRLPNQAS